ncbi:MAG: hypothetical protein KAI79_18405, partial [Bacteroidales bacterium]|nr:hypothetical protein [Bacteroidales bacterium]
LGKWQPVYDNHDSFPLAHYPPTLNFLPFEQLQIDSVYWYYRDMGGASSGFQTIKKGNVTWILIDSYLLLNIKNEIYFHQDYDSFQIINSVIINNLTENEMTLQFYYNNNYTSWISTYYDYELPYSRVWNYKKQ